MIDASLYKVIHLVSIFALFLALGAGIGDGKKETPAPRWLAPVHGVALILILVAGFGMLARLGTLSGGFPLWVVGKLLIWLVMGAMLVLVKRRLLPPAVLIGLLLALGTAAAGLAIWKP